MRRCKTPSASARVVVGELAETEGMVARKPWQQGKAKAAVLTLIVRSFPLNGVPRMNGVPRLHAYLAYYHQ